MRTAHLDPRLAVHVRSVRDLRYDTPADPADDRPPHVRAASGLAMHHGRLVIAQDDASFLAVVARDGVSAIKLPRGMHGRRRFEIALGNKLDKLDLESIIAIDDELWAFGSGSLPIRDKICVVKQGVVRVWDAAPLYTRWRAGLRGAINVEGVAHVGPELWIFHRGNTGEGDPGPAVLHLELAALRRWIDAEGEMPELLAGQGYDLGRVGGSVLGFTDAIADGPRVLYLAAAEATANAIDDGAVTGSHVGVIDIATGETRAASITLDGAPVKAEGIALDPADPSHAWIALDPDDPEVPARLLEVALRGPW